MKIVEGVEERYINRDEPTPADVPETSLLQPPVELEDDARAIWDRLVPDLVEQRVMTAWDVDSFAILCESIAVYHRCRVAMGSKYVVRGSASDVKSPYWQIMRDAAATITSIGSRFGLSPSDRAALTISKADDSTPAGAERLLS